jgi:hypothetical protein
MIQHHRGRGVYAGPIFQRGGAITGFAGPEWQYGGSFNFGSFLWRHAKPLLGYLARTGAKKGLDFIRDVAEEKDIKTAAISRLKEVGKQVATDALDKAKERVAQMGTGIRRRRRTRRLKIALPELTAKRRRRRRATRRTKRQHPVRRRRRVRRNKRINDIFG